MAENITAFDKLTNLADAIRNKTGVTGVLTLDQMTQEIQNFQGGGIELNYKVVSKQPDVPTENTIWVETEDTITKYAFAVENPWVNVTNVDLLAGIEGAPGYIIESSGAIGEQGSNYGLYSEEYLPVRPGITYNWTYTIASSKAIQLTAAEYDSNYNYLGLKTILAATTSAYKEGTYTPSSGNVKYVRLSWRTHNLVTTLTFSGPVELTDPEEAAGAVWFRTAYYSYTGFNALPSNQLQVYPVQAKQYINGSWAEKTCYSYQNNEWKQWMPYGALYWFGNLCEPVSGGSWTPKNLRPNSETSGEYDLPTITNNGDYLLIDWPIAGWGGGAARLDQFQDLTDVSLIRVDYEGEVLKNQLNVYMSVYAKESVNHTDSVATIRLADPNNAAGTAVVPGVIGRQTRELDVSALAGMHGLRFYAWDSWSGDSSQVTLKIYSITKIYEN